MPGRTRAGRLLPLHQLALLGAPRLRLGFADALSSRDERGNQRYERGAVALRNPVRPRRTDELRHRCSRTRRRAGARAACAELRVGKMLVPGMENAVRGHRVPRLDGHVGAFLSEGDGYGSSDAAVAARDERDSAPISPCRASADGRLAGAESCGSPAPAVGADAGGRRAR